MGFDGILKIIKLINMKTLYKTTCTAEGGRNGTAFSADSKLDVKLSVPKGLGGEGGEGTNPEQLFGAAYAACFGGALELAAKKKDISIDGDVSVAAHIEIGKTKEDDLQLRATLDCYIPGVDIKTGEELVNAAHEICPYSRATRDNITVTLNLMIDSEEEE